MWFQQSRIPRRIGIIFAVLASFSIGSDGSDLEIKGVKVPETIMCGDHPLVLNGTILRKKFGFSIYVGALYLAEPSRDAEKILNQDRKGKRLHMTMLRQLSEDDFAPSVRKFVDTNFTNEEKHQFARELEIFFNCFASASSAGKGSEVNIDFIPNKGMEICQNERVLVAIPGDEFYHAILRLWIGRPPQKSIKSGLLGLSP